MPEYKGTIKKWKSVGSIWDILYPKTTIDQVINLSTALANMQSDIESHTHDDRYYTESEINTLLAGKQATITGAATTVVSNNLTAWKVVTTDGNGKLVADAVNQADLANIAGSSGNFQTQLNGKAASSHTHSFDALTPSSVVVKTTNYRPVLSDANKLLYVNSTSNLYIYIASTGTTVFPIGTEIHVLRYGTGEVTITPDSGVTLLSDGNKRNIGAQYGVVTVKKILANTWVLFGSLKL